jgi:predicted nucleic-acid-binding Zn-ribbon protein
VIGTDYRVPATCPKCGLGELCGPRYSHTGDCLIYTCDRCGYVEYRPPVDRIISRESKEA